MPRLTSCAAALVVLHALTANAQLRVALAKQTFLPNGQSPGPNTMAEGRFNKPR